MMFRKDGVKPSGKNWESDSMVRILEEQTFVEGKRYIRAVGLSTDTKPTEGVITGSEFSEVDTGKTFAYAEGDQWYEKY